MLAKTFMVQPKIILLDEPTASLDPDIALDVQTLIIEQQKKFGLTVSIASHDMDEVAAMCNRVIVLKEGIIIDDDTPTRLAQSISTAHVHLIVTSGLEHIITYLTKNDLMYKIFEKDIEINIEEHNIAHFLMELAHLKVHYSSISVKKPTLENYFLEIARISKELHV